VTLNYKLNPILKTMLNQYTLQVPTYSIDCVKYKDLHSLGSDLAEHEIEDVGTNINVTIHNFIYQHITPEEIVLIDEKYNELLVTLRNIENYYLDINTLEYESNLLPENDKFYIYPFVDALIENATTVSITFNELQFDSVMHFVRKYRQIRFDLFYCDKNINNILTIMSQLNVNTLEHIDLDDNTNKSDEIPQEVMNSYRATIKNWIEIYADNWIKFKRNPKSVLQHNIVSSKKRIYSTIDYITPDVMEIEKDDYSKYNIDGTYQMKEVDKPLKKRKIKESYNGLTLFSDAMFLFQ